VGEENFEWVVETAANYAIERAKAQKAGQDNLTWGEYIKLSVAGKPIAAAITKKAPSIIKPEEKAISKASDVKKVAEKPVIEKKISPKGKKQVAKKS
ncbi:MAG: hypothetical protein H7325_12675, partial [Pedobacter sp.]|nr:hypothetical protein [Pedobacter sp.]